MLFLLAALNTAHAIVPFSNEEFSFRLSEGLIRVEVQSQWSQEPLHFLFDSGASVSILNLPTAQKLGVKFGRKTIVQGVAASLPCFWSPQLPLKIGKVAIEQKFLIADLGKLSGTHQENLDGLIGADFFKGRIVQIDYSTETIRLVDSQAPAPMDALIPLKITSSGTFLLSASINHNPAQWFRLDTGCASSLQWVAEAMPMTRKPESKSVALERSSSSVQTISTFESGPILFDALPTAIWTKPIFAGEAGLVGNGMLSRFGSITIDAKAGRLIVKHHQPR